MDFNNIIQSMFEEGFSAEQIVASFTDALNEEEEAYNSEYEFADYIDGLAEEAYSHYENDEHLTARDLAILWLVEYVNNTEEGENLGVEEAEGLLTHAEGVIDTIPQSYKIKSKIEEGVKAFVEETKTAKEAAERYTEDFQKKINSLYGDKDREILNRWLRALR